MREKIRSSGLMNLIGHPEMISKPGLPFGGANEFVYQDLLGYSSEEIQKMRERGVI